MLSGIKVLSFTHFLQGPSATQMLADLGADVIKIEPPKGAFERSWSGPDAYRDGVSIFFLLANRNIRSLSIDLKSPQAREILERLVKEADVLIESFRPGAMARLGLGPEETRKLNPRLIYCSLSGYGSDGPYRDRPGQDVLLQATSGLAAATGSAGEPPTPAGASIVDQHGATLGAMGILAALIARERSGQGTRVESNLLNSALDLQIEPLGYYLNGFVGERSPSGISSQYYKAPYGVFATSDGFTCLSLTAPAKFGELLNDSWLGDVDPDDEVRYREEINSRIASALLSHTTAYWEEAFSREGIWNAPVNTYEDVVHDPQVNYNESFVEFDHPDAGRVKVLAHPVTYDGRRPKVRTAPPRLGQQSKEILAELGYTGIEIETLLKEGVVQCCNPDPSTRS